MERSSDREPGRRWGRVAAVALAALTVAGGCTRAGSAQGGSARDELRRAAKATLTSKSFAMRTRMENDSHYEETVVYQAPDRLHRTLSEDGAETITVGRYRYSTSPTAAGSYVRSRASSSGPSPEVAVFLSGIRTLAAATDVTQKGSSYHYRVGTGWDAISGSASIYQGRIDSYTFSPARAQGVLTSRISDYDQAPAVDPPPSDKVFDKDHPNPGTIAPAIVDLLAKPTLQPAP